MQNHLRHIPVVLGVALSACGGAMDEGASPDTLGASPSALEDDGLLDGNYYRADWSPHQINISGGSGYVIAPAATTPPSCWQAGVPIYRNITLQSVGVCNSHFYMAERYAMCATTPGWYSVRLELWPAGYCGGSVTWFVERDPVTNSTNYSFNKF